MYWWVVILTDLTAQHQNGWRSLPLWHGASLADDQSNDLAGSLVCHSVSTQNQQLFSAAASVVNFKHRKCDKISTSEGADATRCSTLLSHNNKPMWCDYKTVLDNSTMLDLHKLAGFSPAGCIYLWESTRHSFIIFISRSKCSRARFILKFLPQMITLFWVLWLNTHNYDNNCEWMSQSSSFSGVRVAKWARRAGAGRPASGGCSGILKSIQMAAEPLGHICWNRQVAYLKQQPSVSAAKGQAWQTEVPPESSVRNQMDWELTPCLAVTRWQTWSQYVLSAFSWTDTADLPVPQLWMSFFTVHGFHFVAFIKT